jgi:uncharacterized protein
MALFQKIRTRLVGATGEVMTQSASTTRTDSKVETTTETTAKPRRPRGFAAMDRTRVSEIARKGGKAAHVAGTAHEFTRDEAREAGRKGGYATHAKRKGTKPDETPSA